MKKWAFIAIPVGILMGAAAYWSNSRPWPAAQLMQSLPPDRSVHTYLNVGALRDTGLLDLIAGSPAIEDADYKQFVAETGFNYRTDLDAVAIAFRDGDRYFAAQGRFDWPKLSAYATKHEGKCAESMCTLPGSEPGRVVSYYMLRADVLAVGTSSQGSTARDMVGQGNWADVPVIPPVALWVSAPPYTFTDLESMPSGTKYFLSPMESARSTIFTLGPGAGAYELKVTVTADTEAAATELAKTLTERTEQLTKMLRLDNQAARKDDISGVLIGGKFTAKAKVVTGSWPIASEFVKALAAAPPATAPESQSVTPAPAAPKSSPQGQ
jgi:hypothetical protein